MGSSSTSTGLPSLSTIMTQANNPTTQQTLSTSLAPYLSALGVDPSALFGGTPTQTNPADLTSQAATTALNDPTANPQSVTPPAAQASTNTLSGGVSLNPVGVTNTAMGSTSVATPQIPFGNLGQPGIPTDWSGTPSFYRRSMFMQPRINPLQFSPHDF